MIQIKLDFENIILALFFGLLLFIGPGSVLSHRLSHDFPYGYSASDAFQHQIRAEAIKDAGNFRHEASYISFGLENLIGRYPPIVYHLAVIFSYASGLEVYDIIYFIVFFFAIIGSLLIYAIIRDFNKNIALISLPFTLLIFSYPLSIGFTWGHWPSLLGQFFLIAFVWSILRIDLKNSYLLIALAFASVFLAHTAAAVFGALFLILFLIIKLLSKHLKKIDLKKIVIGFAISFILSFHYLIIFLNTWLKTQPYVFSIMPVWEGNPGFYIAGFGILLIFIAAGILFALLKLKDLHISLVFAFAMLIFGFMNYLGFEVRSFQLRFFWPLYLAVFFGFGIYMLLKLLIKEWNALYTIILFAVFTILLLGIVKIPYMPQYSYSKGSQGVMSQYHWNALKWLSENTPKNSKIYFMYGDIYGQDALLRNSKRTHYQADPNNFAKSLQSREIKSVFISELPGDSGGTPVVRKGFFSFEDATKAYPQEYFFRPQDICRFDYIVYDKISQFKELAQYNILIASELLKKDYIKKAFENEVVVILKNTNPGADCIEERNF